jgi:hypothetical protein
MTRMDSLAAGPGLPRCLGSAGLTLVYLAGAGQQQLGWTYQPGVLCRNEEAGAALLHANKSVRAIEMYAQ